MSNIANIVLIVIFSSLITVIIRKSIIYVTLVGSVSGLVIMYFTSPPETEFSDYLRAGIGFIFDGVTTAEEVIRETILDA